MGKEVPFMVEPNGMVRTWVDNHDGTYTVKSVQQNETEIIEENKAMYNHNDGYSPSRTLRRVGRITQAVQEDYLSRGINLFHPENEHILQRLMDDIDYRHLRTAPGRFGKKHRHI